MNYLIAVLANKQEAEKAYFTLEREGIPTEQITIVGKGYQTADQFGLIDPNKQAGKGVKKLVYWLISFGFVAGYLFNLLTGIEILAGANNIVNHAIGGFLGAASGALGAFLVGGATGWTVGSGDALTYRNRLDAGKYLIVTKGQDTLIRQATQILRQFEPEYIQGYTEPVS